MEVLGTRASNVDFGLLLVIRWRTRSAHRPPTRCPMVLASPKTGIPTARAIVANLTVVVLSAAIMTVGPSCPSAAGETVVVDCERPRSRGARPAQRATA